MKPKNPKKRHILHNLFDKIAYKVTKGAGSPYSFILAILIILIWVATGPIFNYSDTWQLVINTGTTIITFIMVFVIQQTVNKDTMAMQLKLNELIACSKEASNRLIDVEDLTEIELEQLKQFYVKLARLAKKEVDLHKSHSIDEAIEKTKVKSALIKKKPSSN